MIIRIDANVTLQQKLNNYQAAMLIRAACLELPGLLGGVISMITGDNAFLLFSGIMAAFLLVWRPGRTAIQESLELSQEEAAELDAVA